MLEHLATISHKLLDCVRRYYEGALRRMTLDGFIRQPKFTGKEASYPSENCAYGEHAWVHRSCTDRAPEKVVSVYYTLRRWEAPFIKNCNTFSNQKSFFVFEVRLLEMEPICATNSAKRGGWFSGVEVVATILVEISNCEMFSWWRRLLI